MSEDGWVQGAISRSILVQFLVLIPMAAQTPRFNLVGSAEQREERVRLTPARTQTVGAMWMPDKQSVHAGFTTTFKFQLTNPGGLGDGADGFAFVLQNAGSQAIGGRGAAGGFALGDGYGDPKSPGIPNSIAVFFDTYRNSEVRDPSNNYVAICTNRTIREMQWPPPRLAYTRRLPFKLNDGRIHQVRIAYEPPLLRVSLDGAAPILSAPVDLSTVIDPAGRAYVGFTASTGAGFENHDIFDWNFTAVDSSITTVDSDITFLDQVTCLEGRNLCTPKDALVEETSPGVFHIILPANREWGASIANPSGAEVSVTNIRGHVCWDAEQCNGPGGSEAELADRLAPGRKAGTLVAQNDRGRTWFSVNDRKNGFADNQGFFDFEVRLK